MTTATAAKSDKSSGGAKIEAQTGLQNGSPRSRKREESKPQTDSAKMPGSSGTEETEESGETGASVFRTKGGRCAVAMREMMRVGPLPTGKLAEVMGVPGRRVYGYLCWALRAGAVIVLEHGAPNRDGKLGRQTIFAIGPTPTEFGKDHRPYRVQPRCYIGREDAAGPLPLRQRTVPASDAPRIEVSAPRWVFDWQP